MKKLIFSIPLLPQFSCVLFSDMCRIHAQTELGLIEKRRGMGRNAL